MHLTLVQPCTISCTFSRPETEIYRATNHLPIGQQALSAPQLLAGLHAWMSPHNLCEGFRFHT